MWVYVMVIRLSPNPSTMMNGFGEGMYWDLVWTSKGTTLILNIIQNHIVISNFEVLPIKHMVEVFFHKGFLFIEGVQCNLYNDVLGVALGLPCYLWFLIELMSTSQPMNDFPNEIVIFV